MNQSVYMAGTDSEAAFHVRPLAAEFGIRCLAPDIILEIAKPGDLVLFYSEHFDRFRDCCRQLKNRGVATLYMIDGILEWRNAWENHPGEPACPWTMRPALSHKIACIGASQARILNSWGNSGRTEIVGIPRLDEFPAARTPRLIDGTFRVLVMTAKCPGFTAEQVAVTQRSLAELIARCPNMTSSGRKIELVWRLTAGLEDKLGVRNSLGDLSGEELAKQLLDVDAVITTPSTSLLEAMLANRPVALLDFHRTPRFVSAIWTISHSDDIHPTLLELAEPSEAKLHFQRTVLADNLYLKDRAVNRMSRLIREMLAASLECINGGKPLEFRPNLLPLEVDELEFDHRRLYSGNAEFSKQDLVELQCELAHSRREINHLQSELKQAKSELAEAHQIFEQIQQHPVAGPIVRVRQMILDRWNRLRNGT